MKNEPVEKLLWSIALPGFGQLLNGKLIKGLLLIILEFLINIKANLNAIIILSFQGEITQSIAQTNYAWLMFYPCVYLFAIWDAYKDAGGGKEPFSYLPFVFSAYFGTIGVIYSSIFSIQGIMLGPVWLSIIFLLVGASFGSVVKILLLTIYK